MGSHLISQGSPPKLPTSSETTTKETFVSKIPRIQHLEKSNERVVNKSKQNTPPKSRLVPDGTIPKSKR